VCGLVQVRRHAAAAVVAVTNAVMTYAVVKIRTVVAANAVTQMIAAVMIAVAPVMNVWTTSAKK